MFLFLLCRAFISNDVNLLNLKFQFKDLICIGVHSITLDFRDYFISLKENVNFLKRNFFHMSHKKMHNEINYASIQPKEKF